MGNKKYLIFIFLTFIIAFFLGSGEFPFDDTIQTFFIKFNSKDLTKYETIDPLYLQTDVESITKIYQKNDIYEIRNNLKEFIWRENSFSYERLPSKIENNFVNEKFYDFSNLQKIDKLTVNMENGISSSSYLLVPNDPNNELVIYHAGHEGDFLHGKKTINSFLKNNYSVLAFSMPLFGNNNNPIIDHPRFGKIKMTNHDSFYFLDSENFSSIKYFVEPILTSLNYSIDSYGFISVYMIGISGGAWTTTLYAAIDDRITKSFPVAGPLPIFLRADNENLGHYEHINPELYETANYLELYILGSHGANREQVKIINKYDSCCHYGISYQIFEDKIVKILDKLDSGSFEVYLDDTHMGHKISDTSLNLILQNIKDQK
ncbi:hypothetical protein [Nitrosopumilus adriaticus]|uniref:hypothetical protein n=1 Tax=Nitrosopumilus adriaticus TaxID=1580092 RepID=UPI00352BE878